jgi:hypothetical protein
VGQVVALVLAWIAQAQGLTQLDSALSGTGRIAETAIKPAAISADGGAPVSGEIPVRAIAAHADDPPAVDLPAAKDEIPDQEQERVERRVQECRIEVARRRRVAPARVSAAAVTVRWTIEATGRVRDAEAIAAPGTDLEVAACAKRVLSESVFARPGSAAVTMQRTYKF